MKNSQEDRNTILLKEYEFLQNIIARQENTRLTIRNWFMGFITALSIAYLSNSVSIPKNGFLLVSVVLILLFYWTELVYRVAEKRAMIRSDEVEKYLREGTEYDGPKIGLSLGKSNRFSDQLKEIPTNIRISGPYVVISILILLIALFCK